MDGDFWVLVTGGSSGLGLHICKEFAKRGYSILIACRNSHAGSVICKSIKAEIPEAFSNKVEYFGLDLSELSSIRKFVRHIQERQYALSALINNAAVYAPPHGTKTHNGLDLSFGVNYVAPFYLTNLILPYLLRQGCPCKIINIGCSEYQLCPRVDLPYVTEQARLITIGGFLLVTVESARNLSTSGIGRRANPYVRVIFRGAERRTRTLMDTLNPEWHDHVSYTGIQGDAEQDHVEFIVMNRGSKNSFPPPPSISQPFARSCLPDIVAGLEYHVAVKFGPDKVLGRAAVSLAGLSPIDPADLDSEMVVEAALSQEPAKGSSNPRDGPQRGWRTARRGSESFALEAVLAAAGLAPGPAASGGGKAGGSAAGSHGISEVGDRVRFELARRAACCGGGRGRAVVLDGKARELREEDGGGRVRRCVAYDRVLRVEGVMRKDVEVNPLSFIPIAAGSFLAAA